MNRAHILPAELQYLAVVAGDRSLQYRDAPYLKAPFKSNKWPLEFGNPSYNRVIDFDIQLEDRSLLTDRKHSELLETFKTWICIQSHFDTTGGRVLSPVTTSHKVYRTLTFIDYFLLEKRHFQLAKYGLKTITENDLLQLVVLLCSSHKMAYGIYGWPKRLTEFLRAQIRLTNPDLLSEAIRKQPDLADALPDQDERMLTLADDEIVSARAWLWSNDFYKQSTNLDYAIAPSTLQLAQLIYKNTLGGQNPKPIPPELLVAPLERYRREYPAVSVHMSRGATLGKVEWYKYRRSLFSLGLLADIGLSVPVDPLRRLSQRSFKDLVKLRPPGRFRTLPKTVVFPALRDSIEFSLEYGDDIVKSTISVVRHARKLGVKTMMDSRMDDISGLVTPKLRKHGVQTWSLSNRMRFIEAAALRSNRQKYVGRSAYLKRVRDNEGLWELVQVLFGSVQLCVGTVSARRLSELRELKVGRCIDSSGKRLHFRNRKTGVLGKRQAVGRPLPKVAIRLIRLLERLQNGLSDEGAKLNLFAPPNCRTGHQTKLSCTQYYDSMDRFCDYFEMPVTKSGERYYIRQHQLRRFFALAFFWGSSFGGVETLRWFLGHVDAEQLYNYITEMMTGDALRNVKAGYAAECAIAGHKEAKALANLLEKHYGTRNFSVLDQDELETYIDDLLQRGTVNVEPEFIDVPRGESYRILIKVNKAGPQSCN